MSQQMAQEMSPRMAKTDDDSYEGGLRSGCCNPLLIIIAIIIVIGLFIITLICSYSSQNTLIYYQDVNPSSNSNHVYYLRA
jgi:hypothetical protein